MTNRHEYTKNTNELYSALVEGLYEVPEMIRPNVDLIEGLSEGNFDVIREGFRGGMVPFLVPDLMEELDNHPPLDEVEFRIVHNGKTIGIIVDKDCQW